MSSANLIEQAVKYREIGSELQREGKFYEALVAFNKSLCHSEKSSVESSEAFEARAEVFYEIAQFEKCLKNILAAKEFCCSLKREERLIELEEKCKKRITENRNEFWFTQLTYPRNEKIPFLVESLQLRENEEFGRFIVSNFDLKAGDVIAFEETKFVIFSPKSISTRCFNCLRSNMLDLQPSSASGEVLK